MDWKGFGVFTIGIVIYLVVSLICDHWPLWGGNKETDVDRLVKQIDATLQGEDPGGPPVHVEFHE